MFNYINDLSIMGLKTNPNVRFMKEFRTNVARCLLAVLETEDGNLATATFIVSQYGSDRAEDILKNITEKVKSIDELMPLDYMFLVTYNGGENSISVNELVSMSFSTGVTEFGWEDILISQINLVCKAISIKH